MHHKNKHQQHQAITKMWRQKQDEVTSSKKSTRSSSKMTFRYDPFPNLNLLSRIRLKFVSAGGIS